MANFPASCKSYFHFYDRNLTQTNKQMCLTCFGVNPSWHRRWDVLLPTVRCATPGIWRAPPGIWRAPSYWGLLPGPIVRCAPPGIWCAPSYWGLSPRPSLKGIPPWSRGGWRRGASGLRPAWVIFGSRLRRLETKFFHKVYVRSGEFSFDACHLVSAPHPLGRVRPHTWRCLSDQQRISYLHGDFRAVPGVEGIGGAVSSGGGHGYGALEKRAPAGGDTARCQVAYCTESQSRLLHARRLPDPCPSLPSHFLTSFLFAILKSRDYLHYVIRGWSSFYKNVRAKLAYSTARPSSPQSTSTIAKFFTSTMVRSYLLLVLLFALASKSSCRSRRKTGSTPFTLLCHRLS